MDKVGSSYIAFPDFIICGIAILLVYRLTTLPPNSIMCRVLAGLCGLMIVAIIVVIPFANNLSHSGVFELSSVGIGLAIGLFKWNDARIESQRASMAPPEFSK